MTATATGAFGNAGTSFGLQGSLTSQASAGVNPGATGADNVLAAFSMAANSFDVAGRGISITAAGGFAANGNTKTVKIIIGSATAVVGSTIGSGGSTIATTGAVATNGTGWVLEASVFKYGAGASNTQTALHTAVTNVGTASVALLAPVALTLPENAPILIAVTGNAATTATDIALNLFQIDATN